MERVFCVSARVLTKKKKREEKNSNRSHFGYELRIAREERKKEEA